MGWKNVMDHYRIEHHVEVTKEGICIGSPYIHNIIVIGLDGKIKKRYEGRSNEDLYRYQNEMDAGPETLRQLVQSPDSFAAAVSVYTYCGGNIIEKQCETPGWPNVTHDGEMMYKNTFSTDKDQVVVWAKENADLGIKLGRERIAEAEKDLSERQDYLASREANRAKLEADYPA